MDRAQVGKVNDRVAVGMAESEMMGLRFDIADKDARAMGKDDRWSTAQVIADNIAADILMPNHLGGRHKVGIASGMVTVMVGIQHIADGLGGYA